jgi:ferrochelatase
MGKTAVVLLNLGGPDSLEAVEPFLYNLFRDPDIFKIPVGQNLFAKIISSRRAPKVIKEYELIGGKSPIGMWTEKQRSMLEKKLQEYSSSIDVITAMRYWHPLISDVAAKLSGSDYEKILLLPLYPHYSISTTGSSFNEFLRFYKGDKNKLIYVNDYFTQHKYIRALNERIDEALNEFSPEDRKKIHLVFSAHGTPVSLVKQGDPYSVHIKKTVEAVMRDRAYSHPYHQCYQSKVGPVKWLEPSTADMIKRLAEQNERHLLVIPVSFVSDHVETSFELDIEYRHVADEAGIEKYIVMKGLNDSHTFVEALCELAVSKLGLQ